MGERGEQRRMPMGATIDSSGTIEWAVSARQFEFPFQVNHLRL
jgi:hypothetical protein